MLPQRGTDCGLHSCVGESVRLPGMHRNRPPPTRSCAKMATCALRAVEAATTAAAELHCDVTCD